MANFAEDHGDQEPPFRWLEIYDAMTAAVHSGNHYRTVLDPLPGRGARHSSLRTK